MVGPPRGAACIVVLAVSGAGGCGRVGFDAAAPDVMVPADRDGGADGGADGGVDLTSGLIAYYAMDDDPAQGALDTSGHHLDGACAGGCPTRTPGRIGTAAHFDGTTRYMVLDDPLFHLAAFTITLWIRSAQNGGTLLAKPQLMGPGASFEVLKNLNVTAFCTDDDPGPAGERCLDGPAVPAMDWTFLAMAWDGTTKTLQVGDGPRLEQVATTVYDTSSVVIGADFQNGAASFSFDGDLDEIRIYDRVLDANQLAALHGP